MVEAIESTKDQNNENLYSPAKRNDNKSFPQFSTTFIRFASLPFCFVCSFFYGFSLFDFYCTRDGVI